MVRQSGYDPRHPLVRRSFKAKALTCVELQPAALVDEKLAPIEESLSLRERFDAVEFFPAQAARLGKTNIESLMAVRTGDFPCSFLNNILDPHLLKFGVVGATT